MKDTPEHLKALEEIERTSIPGLVEMLREEGIDAVRYSCRVRPVGIMITLLPPEDIGPALSRRG